MFLLRFLYNFIIIIYSEDINNPGILNSNLGMYRIQLTGNKYILNQEIGMHYQIHRGIGVHQKNANDKNLPLKVSIFVGGPPAHTFAAVMPLPEGMSEVSFAGVLAKRRFRYSIKEGFQYAINTNEKETLLNSKFVYSRS